jgi:hypothetical protein
MAEQRDDFDNPWKSILEKYFPEFMVFFFPGIHDDIDWMKGHDFMDQEFQQIVRDADLNKRYVDKLVRVWRLNGLERLVFVHIEIQSQEDSNFSSRMFVYNYRIRDCYDKQIVSLAILGDDRANWRPQSFRDELWGCEVTFRFPMVKLLDYESRWSELEASRNPFAIAVMAHLKTKETQKDLRFRKEWKFQLTRRLYEQDFERQDIMELFLFVDWLMELPEGLKREFKAELNQYEQEKQMRYVSSIEQMAIEDTQIATAKKMLEDEVPVETIVRYTGLSIEKVLELQSRQDSGK